MARIVPRLFNNISRRRPVRAADVAARLLLESLEQRDTPSTLFGRADLRNPEFGAAGRHLVVNREPITAQPDAPVAAFNGVAAGESITVGANSHVTAADFRSSGTLTLPPGTTGTTQLTNAGSSDLMFAGGNTFISNPANSGYQNAGIDLNGANAVVTDGRFVNNGFVIDSTGGGGHVVAGTGGLVKGAGFYQNPVETRDGGRLQVGNSPGRADFGSYTFGPGGVSNFLWQINDATGVAGPTPDASNQVRGWSLVRAVQIIPPGGSTATSGDFVWSATSSSKLTFSVQTLIAPTTVGTDPLGPMDHFNPNGTFTWTVLTYAGTYTGPATNAALNAATTFDTSGVVNPFPGSLTWSLNTVSKTLSLVYNAPTVFTVTSTGDTGTGAGTSGDLRFCITQADATPGRSAIVFSNTTAGGAVNFFDGATRTINLTSPLPVITAQTSITGPGADKVTVNANNTGRVLNITNGAASLFVTVSGLTLTGGNATSDGGGVFVGDEEVTLDGLWVQGNTTTTSGGGVGLGSGAILTVKNSAVTGNRAGNLGAGVGGANSGPAVVLIQNSTISGNSAGGEGGGIGLDPFAQPGTLTIQNTTITNNTSTGGGGIRTTPTGATPVSVDLFGSIVSGNAGPAGSPDVKVFRLSADHSAVGNTTGAGTYFDAGGSLVGATLNLQPLAFNGGPTPTHALGAGSAAINTGTNPAFLPFDQRGPGFTRTFGSGPDMGAFEAQTPPAPTVAFLQVNGGATQRSEVRSLTVTFSGPVTIGAGAFTLTRQVSGGNVGIVVGTPTTDGLGRTVVTLTFDNTNPAVIDQVSILNGGQPSLADGVYRLTINDGTVTGPGGALDGDFNGTPGGAYQSPLDTAGSGAGRVFGLFRLFGDSSGNGVVDLVDLQDFRTTFNQVGPNPPFLAFFDANNDNVIDLNDLQQFRTRFNATLF